MLMWTLAFFGFTLREEWAIEKVSSHSTLRSSVLAEKITSSTQRIATPSLLCKDKNNSLTTAATLLQETLVKRILKQFLPVVHMNRQPKESTHTVVDAHIHGSYSQEMGSNTIHIKMYTIQP